MTLNSWRKTKEQSRSNREKNRSGQRQGNKREKGARRSTIQRVRERTTRKLIMSFSVSFSLVLQFWLPSHSFSLVVIHSSCISVTQESGERIKLERQQRWKFQTRDKGLLSWKKSKSRLSISILCFSLSLFSPWKKILIPVTFTWNSLPNFCYRVNGTIPFQGLKREKEVNEFLMSDEGLTASWCLQS